MPNRLIPGRVYWVNGGSVCQVGPDPSVVSIHGPGLPSAGICDVRCLPGNAKAMYEEALAQGEPDSPTPCTSRFAVVNASEQRMGFSVWHPSYDNAVKEAERLARKHPKHVFVVVQVVGPAFAVRPTEPPVERLEAGPTLDNLELPF